MHSHLFLQLHHFISELFILASQLAHLLGVQLVAVATIFGSRLECVDLRQAT